MGRVVIPYVYGYNCTIAANFNLGAKDHEAAQGQTKGCASCGVRATRRLRLFHHLRRYIDPTRVERWSSVGASSQIMAKVRSERDLVDNGIRALVDALGYSGAARFLRHFSKGNGDYLEIQNRLFKGKRIEQIYKNAKKHHETHKQ
jgi:hypothetical protein